MSTLIVYAGKYGCTEKCVNALTSQIKDPVEVINLHHDTVPELSNYDCVIVGGSIYFGQFQKACKQFCTDHLLDLKRRKLGLFICNAAYENTEQFLKEAYPAELLEHATAKAGFGGELNLENMRFLDKFLAKIITKSAQKENKPLPSIHWDEVEAFSETMNLHLV
ncbi:flavodoxin domain-containing protein [Paenibacillus puldeungensis]|uniref:Flavodoxin domain-containing protein n=1 Tax=Paenibacillus puldeungensis TaxID=696536 RepID=A0ABW3S4U4_9BACL